MKRSMMQVYVTRSDEAVAHYQKAFNAVLTSSYANTDGTFYHAELDIHGHVLALSERDPDTDVKTDSITGNTMQFCLQYAETEESLIRTAYETLKIGAQINTPLEPCDYSPLMADLTDKFGIRWCLFI